MLKSRAFRAVIGVFSLVSIAAVLIVLYFVNPNEGHGLIPCPLHAFTGLYCPGCGTARAVHSLLHLQVFRAFRFNPASMILLPFIAFYVVFGIFDFMKTGSNRLNRILPQKPLIVILVLLMIFGIFRNVPIEPFNWLAPTVV